MDIKTLLNKINEKFRPFIFLILICVIYSITINKTYDTYYLLKILPSYPTYEECSS